MKLQPTGQDIYKLTRATVARPGPRAVQASADVCATACASPLLSSLYSTPPRSASSSGRTDPEDDHEPRPTQLGPV